MLAGPEQAVAGGSVCVAVLLRSLTWFAWQGQSQDSSSVLGSCPASSAAPASFLGLPLRVLIVGLSQCIVTSMQA